MKVPFVDLKVQYDSIKKEIDDAIRNVVENLQFIGGDVVRNFENEFASYLGVNQCIGCGNGTDAIEIALAALHIGHGDEVLVPAMSWISTSEAVSNVGATPVFVDVHPNYYTIDPSSIAEKITSKTKAIIPVHLYGLPCDMDPLMSIAKERKLRIIEDCAQAHGATYKGKKAGSFGDLGTFSFYPSKNLGAYGDAGAIVTNSEELAKRCRLISNHGQQAKHDHLMEGRNSNLDTIQAAVLRTKLRKLDQWNEKRRVVASWYDHYLNTPLIKTPQRPIYASHVHHVYGVLVEDREDLIKKLASANVNSQIHYPHALPFLPAYNHMEHQQEDFKNAYNMSNKELSLPMYPEITPEQIEYVCKKLIKAVTSA